MHRARSPERPSACPATQDPDGGMSGEGEGEGEAGGDAEWGETGRTGDTGMSVPENPADTTRTTGIAVVVVTPAAGSDSITSPARSDAAWVE